MKAILVLISILLFFSCDDKEITGNYYSTLTNEIIILNNNYGKHYDLFLSKTNECSILDLNTIQVNDINYHFESKNDSLVIYDFPDDQQYHNDTLVFVKFKNKKLKSQELNSTSWSMEIEKTDRTSNKHFVSKEIIKFDNDLYASYVRGNDTILGETYKLNNQSSEDFVFYNIEKHKFVIPLTRDENTLKILILNSIENRTYTLRYAIN